jgi:hypothetical protein
MIFLMVFSALAVSLSSLSNVNAQVADNHTKTNRAFAAAQSGLECALYIAKTAVFDETCYVTISDAEANQVWADLQTYVQNLNLDGRGLTTGRLSGISGDYIRIAALDIGASGGECDIEFRRLDSDIRTFQVVCTGREGQSNPITRTVSVDMSLGKGSDVLNFAIASRGRMWLTGDTTIHGNVYSSWDRADVSPFNMTSDSSIEGTVNTVLTLNEIDNANAFELETLTASDKPMFYYSEQVYDTAGDPIAGSYGSIDDNNYMVDISGNPVFDASGNRVVPDYNNRYYSSGDELLGYHEGVGYGVNDGSSELDGMDISHYNTDSYVNGLVTIGSSSTTVEYFPHASGNYSYPRDGTPSSTWNQKFNRHVYENQTFTDALLPCGRNALFRNCTFEGILYLDCYKTSTSSSSYTNNVRFEDCNFNGVVVTDVPQPFNWQRNCLYFTGAATFNNQSQVQEATILAPHFNVNLGNTNPQQSDNNVLTGAIVGGIVDVRGNAQIYGTIISMCDTTSWSSGYVTNIGATLNDGGSETTDVGDIGTIGITPEEGSQLPSGITTPIVMQPNMSTYSESI